MNQEIIYNWYHHMMPIEEQKEIEKSIKNKDFETFINFYKKYNSRGLLNGKIWEEFDSFCPVIYLPDTAYVYENGKVKEEIDILERGNFNKITFSENECG